MTVTLPVDTLNAALMALSKFPFEQAAPHINAIQAAAQMAQLPADAVRPLVDAPAAEEGSEGGHAD